MPGSDSQPGTGAPCPDRPLSGLFAINKPSGTLSMRLLEKLQSLFSSSKLFVQDPGSSTQASHEEQKSRRPRRWKQRRVVKIGQGGTLDPLASGVLVIGLNSATKKLAEFLDCTKKYRVTGLLGCETDSYDSCGKVIKLTDWKHVKPEDIQRQCDSMKGENWQIPPIFSALKMDGKPLYEYARKNIPLPRPIEARRCEITEIKVLDWQEPGKHSFKWPTEMVSEADRLMLEKTSKMIEEKGVTKAGPHASTERTQEAPKADLKRSLETETQQVDSLPQKKLKTVGTDEPGPPVASEPVAYNGDGVASNEALTIDENGCSPAFTLEMTVSSGTYVRTVVHDIGKAVGSAATVVSLTRIRQGKFSLETGEDSTSGAPTRPCIDWDVFEKAIQAQRGDACDPPSEADGLREWERQLLQNIES